MNVAATPKPTDVPAGYTLRELLFDGAQNRVYRCSRDADGAAVVLKVPREDVAGRDVLARIRNEVEILRDLQATRAVHAYGLEQVNHLPVLVLEDVGGESLERLARRQAFTVEQSLAVAAEIAQGLAELHAEKVVHKDINPSNVVLNESTGVVRIIDFGIATRLSQEYASVVVPQGDPATLAYMSPEQTGRMNRAIDYRTDFYSLGAVLYELLTGRRMFDVVEPIEWFHSHIAKQPLAPAVVQPAIPGVVSELVMKLLAKIPENRYQSAMGIYQDLCTCLEQWRAQGRVDAFELARRDVPAQFQVPQRLYGREREVEALLGALDDARGQIAVALVSGRSGVGKSRLINELYKPVTARHGYFIAGKFDQMQQDVPYSGLVGALSDLVEQLLTESGERLAQWKARILAELGGNVRLVIDLVPELALIVGTQPPVPALPMLESEQRFQFTLIKFLQVFSEAEQPLVLVLDDLQWADAGTLKLADLLIDQAEGDSLLVVGAYRDNEIQPGHPLLAVLDELKDHAASARFIALEPLEVADVCRLLADTLWSDEGQVEELAHLVHDKTGGNPFFIDEFLRDLHRQSLIAFDAGQGSWVWDLDRARGQNVTDNLVNLMTYRLQRLPAETRRLLELAACAGTNFSLSLLAVMAEASPRAVARDIGEAVDQGLIAPIRDGYQLVELQQGVEGEALSVEFAFAHDRIQQSAYELLEPSRRDATHLRVGRLLLAQLPQTEQQAQVFSIVKHLNAAQHLIADRAERRRLSRLNLEAGRRARQAASNHIAFEYFNQALATLDEDAWADEYALALELHLEAAETAAFIGYEDELERLLSAGLANARTLEEKVPFYEVKIGNDTFRGRLRRAIDLAKPVLAQLGHRYPAKPNKLHVAYKLIMLKRRLRKCSFESLRDLPPMTDTQHLAAQRLGGSIGSAAMFAEPMLLPLLLMGSVQNSLEYGRTPQTGSSFVALGMIFAASLGEVDRGIAYGQLGLEQCRQTQDARYLSRGIHVYAALVQHWKEPLTETFSGLREAYRLCMQNGDLEYAVHASIIYGEHALVSGMTLDSLAREINADLATFKALRQGAQLEPLQILQQTILNLSGQADDPARLVGQAYDIDAMRPLESRREHNALVVHASAKAMFLGLCFGDLDGALYYADEFDVDAPHSAGFHIRAWGTFMAALVRLTAAVSANKPVRRRLLRKAVRAEKWLAHLARTNPASFSNKLYLVQAARGRVAGHDFEAHADFDQAITQAQEAGLTHEQALANELCGVMHMAAGRTTLGEPYLREARALYRRWGASAKVDELDARFPQLKPSERGTSTATGTMVANDLDITSLMKALKAVADEPVHSRMVAAIIEVALEFAGAQRGVLALRNTQGELCIEAEAEVDGGDPTILQSLPLAESSSVSQVVVNYVARTRASVVIADAASGSAEIPGLERDPYIQRNAVRSVLCLPVTAGAGEGAELIGLLYLENNHATNCFTDERFSMLEIIGVAAAGRLELSRKAAVDGLTDLFNHDYFQNMLAQELAAAARRRRPVSLIMMDIDHFKQFNDTWGHQLGDRVLREVAAVLKDSSRGEDTAARYGGEEMAVILPDTGLDEAEIAAERLRAAIADRAIEVDGQTLGVTVSLGVAAAGSEDDSVEFIRKADEALYRSKAEGRNRVTVAS